MYLLPTGLHGMTHVVNPYIKKSQKLDIDDLPLETSIDDDGDDDGDDDDGGNHDVNVEEPKSPCGKQKKLRKDQKLELYKVFVLR